jgi:hypothetical protein
MGEGARQADQALFRGDDVRPAGGAGVRGQAADVHDRAGIAFLQRLEAGARAEPGAVEDYRGDFPPALRVDGFDRLDGAARCAVDEDVEPAELRQRRVDHAAHGGFVSHIGQDG